MNELSKHISTLLKVHGYAIIPGFGGFVLSHVPSVVSKDMKTIKAPSSEIAFNKGMIVNDGLLIQSYMVNCNLSYPAAERKVKSLVSELNDSIYGKGEVDLPEIGLLKMSVSGVITFAPGKCAATDTRLFGLSDIEMPLLAELQKKESVVIPLHADKPKKGINVWNYIQYAAACVAVVVLYFSSSVSLDNSSLHRYDNMASILPVTINLEPANVGQVMILEDESSDLVSNEKDMSIVEKTINAELEAKESNVHSIVKSKEEQIIKHQPVGEIKRYHIVVASLAPEDDTENAVAMLKKEGFIGAMSVEGNGRVRIILKSYANFEEAVRESEEVRKNTRFKDAWVLTKKI